MTNFADYVHDSMLSRTEFRTFSRQVFNDRNNAGLHRSRLQAALNMPGYEPTQGALIDMLVGCKSASREERQAALNLAQSRINPLLVDRLQGQVEKPTYTVNNSLATRWSILASPSLDIPRRTMRCSTDDSRQYARRAVAAWQANDMATQNAFLEHCIICQDKLAFLLARKNILQSQDELPLAWMLAGEFLEKLSPVL